MTDEKPGTDWEAKKANAGSNAKPANDRPYKPNPGELSPPSDDEVK